MNADNEGDPDGCPLCGGYVDYKAAVIPVSRDGGVMQPTRTMIPYCTKCGAQPIRMVIEDMDYEAPRQ
jgi:hypothetical protein